MERLVSQFRSLPQWQRYAVLLFMPIVLVLYIWFMMISLSLDEKQRLEQDIQRLKEDIKTTKNVMDIRVIDRIVSEEKNLKKEYAIKYEELKKLVGEIPSEKDMDKVLRSIGSIAKRSGVVITGMQLGTPEKVEFHLVEEEGKRIVKEVQKLEEGQDDNQQKLGEGQGDKQQKAQQQAQQTAKQQPQQKLESAVFIKSELKLSLLGTYQGVKSFLKGIEKEGVVSYPHEMNITAEDDRLKINMSIYLIMKEAKQL
ncbi:MAG: type 4a pilus biogenesis protein PilO [Aquificaceae bacterium]|nr:type 4a pilus biogenesis protein PilO [Aquificaceae bacterium]